MSRSVVISKDGVKTLALTGKESDFVDIYMKNGRNAYQAALDAGYTHHMAAIKIYDMMKKDPLKSEIERRVELARSTLNSMYDKKIQMLLKMADYCIEHNKARDLVAVVNELNKMQGDHAAEKRVTVNLSAEDIDIKKIQRQVEEMRKLY